MTLADYQQDIVSQIYDVLIANENNQIVNLYGMTGCGKSTISFGVAEMLQENWTNFFIKGVDPMVSPYLTWHVGTKLYSKNEIKFNGNISFGVTVFPIPLTIEFGSGIPKMKRSNFIINSIEEALITNIKKQAYGNQNILFIVDDYDLWDTPSKQFLIKLILPQLNLMDGFHINILILSQDKFNLHPDLDFHCISVPNISDDNILFILHQNGYVEPVDLNEIRACAGNDISLMLMAADYYKNCGKTRCPDFNEIMEHRYNGLSENEKQACSILEPLSIIDSVFSEDEAAYFIKDPNVDNDECQYIANEYLSIAQDKSFLVGDKNYQFLNQKIREYFRMRLSRREKYLHHRFALYLQQQHPEDYFSRGNHLRLCMQRSDCNVSQEAWHLLLISYVRRETECGFDSDIYQILDQVELLINNSNTTDINIQQFVKNNFLNGCKAFYQYKYKEAVYYLQAISPMLLSAAIRAECQRMIVLCYVQLAENSHSIAQSANELYDLIQSIEFFEDEQYCRAALVLMNVYTDRSNDPNKVRSLKQKLVHIINDHIHCPAFLEFNASFNRKAALYYPASIACLQTEQSVRFYRDQSNLSGLYMSLCNHAANAIVSKQYNKAQQALYECKQILNMYKDHYYPSKYKIKNNEILLLYLSNEQHLIDNEEELKRIAQRTFEEYSIALNTQKDEVSHVIYLNWLGFSILCNSPEREKWLAIANQVLVDVDAYYQYYLHDLNFANSLLNHNFQNAKVELEILEQLDVPLLYPYAPIFRAKRMAQKNILLSEQSFEGNAIIYNQFIIKACSHIQDSSCTFYGRGFLISDLQFLSF